MPKDSRTSQPTISAFFQATPHHPFEESVKRRHIASSPIDLTISDDEQRPSKKLKGSGGARFSAPNIIPSSSAHGGVAPAFLPGERWRFFPGPPDTSGSTSKDNRSAAEKEAARRVHEAFKERLLPKNSLFRQDTPTEDDTVSVSEDAGESSVEDSDDAFTKLTEMFSNKSKKAKGKAKATTTKRQKSDVKMGPSGEAYTPLELQVLQLKADNEGTLLMVEVGYKYKFFGDDAKIAAKELGMVAFNQRNFLIASIPVHRRDVHLKKLLAQGYRVGIAEQTETAALKKVSETRHKPFERKVTHLYTSATYVDGMDSVDDMEGHLVPPFMCLVEERGKNNLSVSLGMITICPRTGDVTWDDFEDNVMRMELETRLLHTRPTEMLLPKRNLSDETTKMLAHFNSISTSTDKIRIEYFNDLLSYTDAFSLVSEFYTDKRNFDSASEIFKSGKLMAAVTDFPHRVVIALAHSIKYLSAFNIADALFETQFFSRFSSKAHMLLAANTMTNLEIYRNETDGTVRGSLLWILDKTKTKFGARLLQSWVGRPLTDKRLLEERVEAVEEILSSSSEKLVSLRQLLKGLPDLAKGLSRIQYGQCTPQELAQILPAFNKIAIAFDASESPTHVGFESGLLNRIIFALPNLKAPINELLQVVNLRKAADGHKATMWIDPERYPGIADADIAIQTVEVELSNELKTIRKLLKMPSLKYVTVAGEEYLIEIKRSEKRPIPASWIIHSKTKHFERYQPTNIRLKVAERAQHQETLEAEAKKAFRSFLGEISQKYYSILRDAINKLATADCLLSFAHVALQDNYVRPQFTEDDVLEIVDGRHPMVEALRPDPFVPNTIYMGGEKTRNKIITGPNMGGKSSCVRMVALISIMAQVGSYVPATSVKLGLLDSILTRMGASDDLARGRSTFMVEMSETSDILHSATNRSLVILDELGRGTSTFDGMAIADAVLHYLAETTKCKTMFITHYPLVASNLEKRFPRDIENLHMGYESYTSIDGSRSIIFLYRLSSGMATESFGVECGRLAGLPDCILSVASQRSSSMQDQVEERMKHNNIRKALKLVNECLRAKGVSRLKVDELAMKLESIFT